MTQRFEPKLSILPNAQREIWPSLTPAVELGFVLYGGTAVALYLGHRESLDFDFFRSGPLNKDQIRSRFGFALNRLSIADRQILSNARDRVERLPDSHVRAGLVAGD